MDDFHEIECCGGIITFSNGQASYSCNQPHSAAIDMFYIKTQNRQIPILLLSDKECYFGFSCPRCTKYFRSTYTRDKILCPYCLYNADREDFLTKNQNQYIKLYIKKYFESIDNEKNINIDLEDISPQLKHNINELKLSEEKQQLHRQCSIDHPIVAFDTLGIHSSCPCCGSRNTLALFNETVNSLGDQSLNARINPDNALGLVIEAFSSMGKDLKYIAEMNITSFKNKETGALDFQKIECADKILKNSLGVEIFRNLSDEEKLFLLHIFQLRHLNTHNGGIVDEKYLAKCPSSTARIGQKISIATTDLQRFIHLLKMSSKRFVNEIYEKIGTAISSQNAES